MNTITIKNQTLSYLGDASMLLCPMTSFLCSHRVPEGVADAIRQWVNGLDSANTCVVCGNLRGGTIGSTFTCRTGHSLSCLLWPMPYLTIFQH